MTDISANGAAPQVRSSILVQDVKMRRRNAAETRFKSYGLIAIAISLAILALMLFTIFRDGISSFRQAQLTFPVELSAGILDPNGARNPADLAKVTTVGYGRVLDVALLKALADKGIALDDPKQATALISKAAPAQLRNIVLANPAQIGRTIEVEVLALGRVDGYFKGRVTRETAERDPQIKPVQLDLIDKMRGAGLVALHFNWNFIFGTDASEQRPEAAGLGIALIGSAYMMLLVVVLSLPIGVAASIYLEEFAPKNRWTDLIEVNISNLAEVPSIVFGILGLAIFINFAQFPMSSSLVGALVLTLMTLPTIIIATRASLRAVPPSIRDAALGVGASKMQTVFHHVLPLAMPGILTGTILGLATALGETAPLLLIGMVAFVTNYSATPLDPATALPVQVYSWASRADPAFIERSNGAIIVLLAFLVVMNVVAILLRRRFETRW